MSTVTKSPSAPLNRSDLSSDISALLTLPPSTLQSLTTGTFSTPQSTSTSSSTTPASQLLFAFSPSSTTDHDASVNLSAAYLREMREVRQSGLAGKLEGLGSEIEGVREGADGVQQALGEVKL